MPQIPIRVKDVPSLAPTDQGPVPAQVRRTVSPVPKRAEQGRRIRLTERLNMRNWDVNPYRIIEDLNRTHDNG